MSLFKKAKETGGATGPAKNQKVEVVIKEPKFHLSLTRLAEVNKEVDALNAEATILAAEVKERGIKEFTKLYENNGKYPGSFLIQANGMKGAKPASLMFIPTDKYIKIGEERYNELVATHGADIAVEKTTYTMNTELIEKYGETISNLIEKCKAIPEADKAKLIGAITTYEIKKGTISELDKYDATIPEMLEDIKPVYQLKNVKIEE